jgi:lysyl-tRNA synthetase class 1
MNEAVLTADDPSIRLDEGALATALIKARPQTSAITPEENTGAFAEVAAWKFSRPHANSDREPWGIYWGPMASGTLADGKPFHSPDIEEIDEDILRHWIARATNAKHPALRARYADLAWEIGRYLKAPTARRFNATKASHALSASPICRTGAVSGFRASPLA